MAKKIKNTAPPRDWFSIAIVISRIMMGAFIILLGYILWTEAGERVYNPYMHSLRKMALPKSKPSDASPIGLPWNDFNKLVIQIMGACCFTAGAMIMAGVKL